MTAETVQAKLQRVNDARILTDILDEHGCTPDAVMLLDPISWSLAAALAHVEQPDDAVKSLVWHRLTERRRLEHTDPLAGLPT